MFDQRRDILTPLAQWRQQKRKNVNPMEQVLTELALFYLRLKITVRRD